MPLIGLTLAWEVIAGPLIGVLAGALTGRAVRAAVRRHRLEEYPALVFSLLLAVAVLGLARLANTDGVLAVLVAGSAYDEGVSKGERGPQ